MTLVRERRGPVELLRIDRPERRNALDSATITELGEALAGADADDGVRAVVVTGTGDRAFCAGMDLAALGEGRQKAVGAAESKLMAFQRRGIGTPVLAAVNGAAVGGGFELALACDLIVAAEHAFFALPEVKRGIMAGGGGTMLPARLPLAVALELGLTGDRLDADRARQLGLVNRVVPGERLLDEALALAGAVAANAPLALQETKRLMRMTLDDGPVAAWEAVDEANRRLFATEDAREGARAFLDRRPAVWRGR